MCALSFKGNIKGSNKFNYILSVFDILIEWHFYCFQALYLPTVLWNTTNQVHMPGSFINWTALGTITQNKKYWSDMATILYSSTLWGEHVPVSTLAPTGVQRRKHTNNIQALHLCCCIFSLNYFITLENIHPPKCELKHN